VFAAIANKLSVLGYTVNVELVSFEPLLAGVTPVPLRPASSSNKTNDNDHDNGVSFTVIDHGDDDDDDTLVLIIIILVLIGFLALMGVAACFYFAKKIVSGVSLHSRDSSRAERHRAFPVFFGVRLHDCLVGGSRSTGTRKLFPHRIATQCTQKAVPSGRRTGGGIVHDANGRNLLSQKTTSLDSCIRI
jgi:hypothetical protein